MTNLKLWQRLAADRAAVVALTTVEMEHARDNNDLERLTIADRYHHQARRLLSTAERKLVELGASV
jgi:hypothetical protein